MKLCVLGAVSVVQHVLLVLFNLNGQQLAIRRAVKFHLYLFMQQRLASLALFIPLNQYCRNDELHFIDELSGNTFVF
jgi:hypothetical protein